MKFAQTNPLNRNITPQAPKCNPEYLHPERKFLLQYPSFQKIYHSTTKRKNSKEIKKKRNGKEASILEKTAILMQ